MLLGAVAGIAMLCFGAIRLSRATTLDRPPVPTFDDLLWHVTRRHGLTVADSDVLRRAVARNGPIPDRLRRPVHELAAEYLELLHGMWRPRRLHRGASVAALVWLATWLAANFAQHSYSRGLSPVAGGLGGAIVVGLYFRSRIKSAERAEMRTRPTGAAGAATGESATKAGKTN